MQGSAPAVCEASFSADGVFVAVDVLARAGSGWNLIEVKSSTSAKPEHDLDVARSSSTRCDRLAWLWNGRLSCA